MTFENLLREVYIHLVEGEAAFVCTVRYGGLPGKSKQFPLEIREEVPLAEESLRLVRIRNRGGENSQGGR